MFKTISNYLSSVKSGVTQSKMLESLVDLFLKKTIGKFFEKIDWSEIKAGGLKNIKFDLKKVNKRLLGLPVRMTAGSIQFIKLSLETNSKFHVKLTISQPHVELCLDHKISQGKNNTKSFESNDMTFNDSQLLGSKDEANIAKEIFNNLFIEVQIEDLRIAFHMQDPDYYSPFIMLNVKELIFNKSPKKEGRFSFESIIRGVAIHVSPLQVPIKALFDKHSSCIMTLGHHTPVIIKLEKAAIKEDRKITCDINMGLLELMLDPMQIFYIQTFLTKFMYESNLIDKLQQKEDLFKSIELETIESSESLQASLNNSLGQFKKMARSLEIKIIANGFAVALLTDVASDFEKVWLDGKEDLFYEHVPVSHIFFLCHNTVFRYFIENSDGEKKGNKLLNMSIESISLKDVDIITRLKNEHKQFQANLFKSVNTSKYKSVNNSQNDSINNSLHTSAITNSDLYKSCLEEDKSVAAGHSKLEDEEFVDCKEENFEEEVNCSLEVVRWIFNKQTDMRSVVTIFAIEKSVAEMTPKILFSKTNSNIQIELLKGCVKPAGQKEDEQTIFKTYFQECLSFHSKSLSYYNEKNAINIIMIKDKRIHENRKFLVLIKPIHIVGYDGMLEKLILISNPTESLKRHSEYAQEIIILPPDVSEIKGYNDEPISIIKTNQSTYQSFKKNQKKIDFRVNVPVISLSIIPNFSCLYCKDEEAYINSITSCLTKTLLKFELHNLNTYSEFPKTVASFSDFIIHSIDTEYSGISLQNQSKTYQNALKSFEILEISTLESTDNKKIMNEVSINSEANVFCIAIPKITLRLNLDTISSIKNLNLELVTSIDRIKATHETVTKKHSALKEEYFKIVFKNDLKLNIDKKIEKIKTSQVNEKICFQLKILLVNFNIYTPANLYQDYTKLWEEIDDLGDVTEIINGSFSNASQNDLSDLKILFQNICKSMLSKQKSMSLFSQGSKAINLTENIFIQFLHDANFENQIKKKSIALSAFSLREIYFLYYNKNNFSFDVVNLYWGICVPAIDLLEISAAKFLEFKLQYKNIICQKDTSIHAHLYDFLNPNNPFTVLKLPERTGIISIQNKENKIIIDITSAYVRFSFNTEHIYSILMNFITLYTLKSIFQKQSNIPKEENVFQNEQFTEFPEIYVNLNGIGIDIENIYDKSEFNQRVFIVFSTYFKTKDFIQLELAIPIIQIYFRHDNVSNSPLILIENQVEFTSFVRNSILWKSGFSQLLLIKNFDSIIQIIGKSVKIVNKNNQFDIIATLCGDTIGYLVNMIGSISFYMCFIKTIIQHCTKNHFNLNHQQNIELKMNRQSSETENKLTSSVLDWSHCSTDLVTTFKNSKKFSDLMYYKKNEATQFFELSLTVNCIKFLIYGGKDFDFDSTVKGKNRTRKSEKNKESYISFEMENIRFDAISDEEYAKYSLFINKFSIYDSICNSPFRWLVTHHGDKQFLKFYFVKTKTALEKLEILIGVSPIIFTLNNESTNFLNEIKILAEEALSQSSTSFFEIQEEEKESKIAPQKYNILTFYLSDISIEAYMKSDYQPNKMSIALALCPNVTIILAGIDTVKWQKTELSIEEFSQIVIAHFKNQFKKPTNIITSIYQNRSDLPLFGSLISFGDALVKLFYLPYCYLTHEDKKNIKHGFIIGLTEAIMNSLKVTVENVINSLRTGVNVIANVANLATDAIDTRKVDMCFEEIIGYVNPEKSNRVKYYKK